MSPCAVGFVPCAPLLIPMVAGGSAGLDAELRAEVIAAVRQLIAAAPAAIVVAAPTAQAGVWSPEASWDFSGFGVERPDPADTPALPWPLGIGAWLLDAAGWEGERRFLGVSASGAGDDLPPVPESAAVLALGDGSARRTEKAPGHLDPRAEAFDMSIDAALAAGDAGGLAAVDDRLAAELMCAGLPVWRWVAAQLAGRAVAHADLKWHSAPYGVAYFVASWTLA